VHKQVVNVVAFHWLASGEDNHAFFECGNRVEDFFALAGSEFVGFSGGSAGTTIDAVETALAGDFKGY